LKGYDQLLNLVLDEATENLRGQVLISPLLLSFSSFTAIVDAYRGFYSVAKPMSLSPQ